MNRRTTERILMEVPITVGEELGTTRDISGGGVYFLTDGVFAKGEQIRFSITLERAIPNKPLKLNCQGKIVRIENMGNQLGIAAKIDQYCYLH